MEGKVFLLYVPVVTKQTGDWTPHSAPFQLQAFFQAPHCSRNMWACGRPCGWGCPAVCCRQLLWLPAACRAGGQLPASLPRKRSLRPSSAARRHFPGFWHKPHCLRHLTAKRGLTECLTEDGALLSAHRVWGGFAWPMSEQYLLDENQPYFCYIQPISTPWLVTFQNPLGSWAGGNISLVYTS